MNPSIICYELNEVPWRLLDDYVDRRPQSNFARLLTGGRSYTTRTPDTGHLSPWITWPTMHRGVDNSTHGIQFIGQEVVNSSYPPVWEQALTGGRSVGVFGALQSWPPPKVAEGFFVPDMFAKDSTAWPKALSAFQDLNLDLTRRNGRVMNESVGVGRVVGALPRLFSNGVRLSTLVGAGKHVLRERVERRYTYRRPVYQSILGFDLFQTQLQRHRPDYASFFTNHVAGLMHRFWRAAYPSDYIDGRAQDEAFYANAIEWGMDVADRQLGIMMRLARRQGAVLAVASSMGQAAIQPKDDPTSLKLDRPEALLTTLGITDRWKRLHAMEPQVPLQAETPNAARTIADRAHDVRDENGTPILRADVDGRTVSLTIAPTHAAIQSETIHIDQKRFSLEEAGIRIIHPETPGTAYHIPEGHLVFWGDGVAPNSGRTEVSSLRYAPTILGLLDLAAAPYHEAPLDIIGA